MKGVHSTLFTQKLQEGSEDCFKNSQLCESCKEKISCLKNSIQLNNGLKSKKERAGGM